MSIPANYTPDRNAILASPWTVVQLSQRDVSKQIPINYVAHPGVYVTSACFGNKIYEEQAMVKCISNLLALDNRRFHVDLYWSADHHRWIFCPVAVNSSAPVPPAATETSAPGQSASVLANVGSYSCSPSLDLSVFLSLLKKYFRTTDDTLNAHMLYIILNVHFAAVDSPGKPRSPPAPNQLPSARELLGSLFNEVLGPYMYTPKQLQNERANLNQSWYSVPRYSHPISEYFTTHRDSKGDHSTLDGWPCESYVERRHLKRFLVGWGIVDLQMAGYNFAGDIDLIFPGGSLAESKNVDISNGSDGSDGPLIKSGCLFDPNSTDVHRLSASWPESAVVERHNSDSIPSLNSELIACGISPIINATLSNVTADEDFKPYQNAAQSSSWAWAQLGPNPYDPPTDLFRSNLKCARADASFKGRWLPTECSDDLYGACRVGNEPFQWTLTRKRISYGSAAGNCPEKSTFSVPRTSLESTYLYHYITSLPKDIINPSSEDYSARSIWIDLNSLDVPSCWVSGGPKAQCPYEVDENAVQRRTVLVPTIAAIIVLVIAALTIFVKCNANRRNSRRKRVIEGWEYEGVPS
ncbi:hypothetical protein EMCG_00155 [[Emmonsia] crescens]|uniref:Maintenance of telomere capping protein 6 n=1 Tax=[Emmonsia] crescens TaxID=73230 RepID=A0A0G2JC04_9EURO|nr:hypothetical protein EMCG_00155 [Emmonsia crescens UAMH 3008]